jgi:hypothetical protein
MRWAPIVVDLACTIAVWTGVLCLLRRRRERAGRGYRLQAAAMICVTAGTTWFSVWLVTDATGPHWLHTLSLPATLIFIGVGAVVSGYAGWVSRAR